MTYDSALLSGLHGGVELKILKICPNVLLTACAYHFLNHCGVHSFLQVYLFWYFREIMLFLFGIYLYMEGTLAKGLKEFTKIVEQLVNTTEELCYSSEEKIGF